MEDILWVLWLHSHVLVDSTYLDLKLVHVWQMEHGVKILHFVLQVVKINLLLLYGNQSIPCVHDSLI